MTRPDPATRLLRTRLVTLLSALPSAQAGDVESVHQARVASRRLREALPVVGAAADTAVLGRARRHVRRVTQALGPVREIDVALGHLDEYVSRGLAPATAAAKVGEVLQRERQARRRAMLAAITPGALQKLSRDLEAMQPAREPGASRPRDEAARRVQRRARRLADAIDRAGSLYLPDRLHAVRVAVKKLRYALEIRREITRSRASSHIKRLKAMQDALGRMHDLDVLIGWTRQAQALSAETDRSGARALDRLVRALEAECRELHAAYMADRDGLAALAATLAAGRRPTAAA
ncbi:MAG: CHAD domain-containing protein [Acidobacteriota bacterium]